MLFNLLVALTISTSGQLADSMTSDRVQYIKAEHKKVTFIKDKQNEIHSKKRQLRT